MMDRNCIVPYYGRILAFLLLLPAHRVQAMNSNCEPVFEAMNRMAATPTHIYATETASSSPGSPATASEMIYSGEAIYVKMSDKWIRAPLTPAEAERQKQQDERRAKGNCRYLHDEFVGGELASVYQAQSQTRDAKSEERIWISRKKGLPLRVERDTDVGGKLGKSHRSLHYEYGGVRRP
jgi:hypothetical protein